MSDVMWCDTTHRKVGPPTFVIAFQNVGIQANVENVVKLLVAINILRIIQ